MKRIEITETETIPSIEINIYISTQKPKCECFYSFNLWLMNNKIVYFDTESENQTWS